MSTNQYLEQLASQLVLSDAEKQSISRSIATLQGHLYNWRHYCSVKNHYYFGSYSRNTILPRAVDPNSDIDYMIEFDDAFRTTPQTYLNWLKDLLIHTIRVRRFIRIFQPLHWSLIIFDLNWFQPYLLGGIWGYRFLLLIVCYILIG